MFEKTRFTQKCYDKPFLISEEILNWDPGCSWFLEILFQCSEEEDDGDDSVILPWNFKMIGMSSQN